MIAYNWRSSIDGHLSTTSSFSKPASDLSAGTHTIYFRVQDDEGAWSTEAAEDLTITEPGNQPPVADANGPYTVTEGIPLLFDGSGSYDRDGGIISYEWDFDNDSVIDGTDQNPTHIYAEDGVYVYTVTLKVYESDGDHNTEAKVNYIIVTKANSPPYKPGSPLPFDGATDVPVDTSLSWTGGDPDTEDTVTYNVYFGTESSPPLVSENQTENTYDPGMLKNSTRYYWRIVASDNHGASNKSDI